MKINNRKKLQINHVNNCGFTLIELMVVVSIIGILASIAIPNYQNYIVRAQISEALIISNAIKPNINEFYEAKGYFPKNNKEAGLPEPKYLIGNYVKGITVEDGSIHIEFGNKINSRILGKILSLRPQYVKQSMITPLAWLCGNSGVVEGMTVNGANKTNINSTFLMMSCK